MDNINERIMLIINHFQHNKNSFRKEIGLSSSAVLENIVGKRQSNPSYGVIFKILTAFPSVSARWLITGEGEMFSKETHIVKSETKPKTEDCTQCEHKQEVIEMQQARIESLNKVIESKDQLINYITNSENPHGRLNDCG